MSSDAIMLVYDVLILICGLYGIYSAVQMKKTGIPSAILISKEESGNMKQAEKFCDAMYHPTILFGAVACLYSLAALLNQYFFKQFVIEILGIVCFLLVCAWFLKKMRIAKDNFA